MKKIIKGDTVVVLTGKDKGKQGIIEKVIKTKVLVKGVNLVKKHMKANPAIGQVGGIIEKEMPIHVSNVALVNPKTGKASRVGFRVLEDNTKSRFFKSDGEIVDA